MHQPLRRCRVCRSVKPKSELTRWVQGDGQLQIDERQIAQMRGLYTCSQACSDKLQSNKERVKR